MDSQPQQLIIADSSGQPWAISVSPDGQLQTAKWPDGEPSIPGQQTEQDIAKALTLELHRRGF